MPSQRERKRAERRKRKQRSSAREADRERWQAEMAARTEARNAEAREQLEPLAPGERPGVVTVAALVSAAVALSIVGGWLLGVEVDGQTPSAIEIVVPIALMGVMAWGLWRARYWAVLGFQAMLAIILLWMTLSLVGATRIEQAIGNVVVITGAGLLFYRMIRAMARIQMPERPGD